MTHPLVRELRRTWHYWAGVGVVALVAVIAWRMHRLQPPMPPSAATQPNILVISTCSLRFAHLATYSSGTDFSPAITELGKRSFVFDNAVTELTWTNLVNFIAKEGIHLAEKHGYRMIGNRKHDPQNPRKLPSADMPYFFRIPDPRDTKSSNGGSRLQLKDYLEELRQKYQEKGAPFFSQVHIKAMHLPFLSTSQELRRLVGRKYPRIRRYLTEPERFPDKVSFFATLLPPNRMEEYLRTHPKRNRPSIDSVLRKKNRSKTYIGLAQNTEFLQDWVTSEGFSEDVDLLKRVYGERLRWYDQEILPLISLFGDPELQKNTIIIFTGDHGEAMMEHGLLTHGETPWEEVIRIPLMVYFPGHQTQHRIPEQFRSVSTRVLIEGMMSGQLRADNFESWVRQRVRDDFAFGRDCANLRQSVRYKNKWKLYYSLGQENWRLYDLEKDPGETREVAKQNPNVVAMLREELENYETARTIGHPTCNSRATDTTDTYGD